MTTRNILLGLLVIVAGIMIYLGIKAGMNPPIFTGVGFIVIAILFGINKGN